MASKINADEFVDREGEGKPTLPQGVVLSGVTTITTAVVAENEVANSTGINAGIITSTHFKGNLTGDVNAGIVTVTSQTVVGSAVTISASGIDIGAGVITATSYVGSGANLTGIGATIMVWEYNPDPYDTAVTFDTGIGITFNQKIKAGSGNITLSIANAGVAGTVVENFAIGSSVTISNNSLSLTPTSNLAVEGGQYCITLPSGVITNMAGDNYVGTAYTFQARTYNYELWSWGANENGALGLNEAVASDKSSPTQIPGTNWTELAKSQIRQDSNFAIKDDGTLWAWGMNQQGNLGVNDRTAYSSPVQVPGTTWANITTTYDYATLATKTDGTLWIWGLNDYGVLGQNQAYAQLARRSSPVQIPGTSWATGRNKITGSGISFGAIKTDGTLFTWGYNANGMLGLNNKTQYSSPTQVPGTTWSSVSGGYWSNTAIKTDGTLWTWGWNSAGKLGHNNQTEYSSPKQVPGTTWSSCYLGMNHAIATKTDGTLWSWGYNSGGDLGQNDTTQRSSPIQIPGTTWSECAIGNGFTYARKTDGTLWAWGKNLYGMLGVGDVVYRSSPTQVPGTDWHKITGKEDGILAIKRV